MTRRRDRTGLPAWLSAALLRILGRDDEWALGDLEERETRRRADGQASVRRLVVDVASTARWGASRRIRRWRNGGRGWGSDLVIAVRSLKRRPGYAAGVVATLGLGIGTVAASFTVVDGVILRPLPYPESDRLVRVYRTYERGETDLDFSAVQVATLSRTAAAAGGMGAFSRAGRILRAGDSGDGRPRSVAFARVTEGFLETLGVSPLIGRLFEPAEVRDGAPVVILSEEIWRGLFDAAPSAIGTSVRLDEVRHTVVGVLPSGSGFPEDALLWRPLTRDERADDDPELVLVARLPEGLSALAFADLLGSAVQAASSVAPASWSGSGARAVTLRDAVLGASVPRSLLVLLAASGLVLLVAITNAAGLQFLRAIGARHDASVRLALGASVPRVVRGLLAESLLLASAGLALGLALAATTLPALRRLAPGAVPRLDGVELDLRVAAVIGGIALTGAVLGALGPALVTARRAVGSIRPGGGIVSGGLRLGTLRTLVAVQLGLTTVLVISAGLLSESFRRLVELPRGFDAEHLLVVPLALSSATGELVGFQERLLDQVERVPGVNAAAVSIQLPGLGRGMRPEMIGIGDLPVPPADGRPAYLRTVSPSFFTAVRLPILQGRALPHGRWEGAGAVVVNQAFARAFLGPEPWVGQRFTRAAPGGQGRVEMEVVGVTADIIIAPGEAPPAAVYVSTEAVPIFKNLLVRMEPAAPTAATIARIHEELVALDPEQPVNVTEWVTDVLGQSGARTRFHARLMSIFGLLALTLAAVGVYGVAAYGASQRRAELGLRRALGSSRGGILALVLGRILQSAAAGIAAGAIGAWVVARLLRGLLFEIAPFDPLVYLAAAAGLGTLVILAGLTPAVRASRDDANLAGLLREG